MSVCKSCWNASREGQRYAEYRKAALARIGITQEDYDYLSELQGHVCALCGRPETKKNPTRRHDTPWLLSVDHDHSCCPYKKGCYRCIRGLLDVDCNSMIGYVERAGGLVVARFADYLSQRPLLARGEVV